MNGRNFWLEFEGEPRKVGFYTTRFVEAQDSQAAENFAIQMLRSDSTLQRVLNDHSDPPIIYAEEVEESVQKHQEYGNTGYSFYPEEADS